MLGDQLKRALERVGVTQARVERWLGKPCNCAERQAKLNALGLWARNGASEFLERLLA